MLSDRIPVATNLSGKKSSDSFRDIQKARPQYWVSRFFGLDHYKWIHRVPAGVARLGNLTAEWLWLIDWLVTILRHIGNIPAI